MRFVAIFAPLAAAVFTVVLAKAEAPAPPPISPCPADMRMVERDHYESIERECADKRDAKHCFAYRAGSNRPIGKKTHERFCMDAFEAPNQRGQKPLVMQSGVDAEAWCRAKGKRLCREVEWETACEGTKMMPWSYGFAADGNACNSGKQWRKFNAEVLRDGGPKAQAELEHLWQGEPSGARASCATEDGIYDLVGNVEEWVSSRPGRQWNVTLIGGFWAKPWTGCRGANDAHEPTFRFYETGFRCCADAH